MDDNDEDEIYADDGFDSLPQDELLRLELDAIQATQQPHDLTDGSGYLKVLPQTFSRYPTALKNSTNQVLKRSPLATRTAPQPQTSSDYGDFDPDDIDVALLANFDEEVPVEEQDEVVVPAGLPGESTQRGQWHQQRYARPNTYAQDGLGYSKPAYPARAGRYSEQLQNEDSVYLDAGEMLMTDAPPAIETAAQHLDEEAEALRAQVQELLREKETLQQDLSTASSNALAKQGEIAIVRANQSKTVTNYDRQITALQRSMADEASKYKAKLEAILNESKRVQTENQFLKQDLAEEGVKVKDLQRNLKGKEKAAKDGPAVTPKKPVSLPHRDRLRDGFDDNEIAVESPSKSGTRSKKGTPSAGAKRKRRVTQDSPIPALELSQARQEPQSFEEPALILTDEPAHNEEPPSKPPLNNGHFQFMQRILNHRASPDQERVLEAFTKHAFPSEPDKALSSILIERTIPLSPDNYPANFTKVIITLWKRCLEEKYHKPIRLLVDMVNFILGLDAPGVAPHIIDTLIPVVHEAVNINGVPRFKNSACSHLSLGRFKPTPKKQLDFLVDGNECLNSLYASATGCLHEEISLRLFWQLVQFDFILMMLNSSQPVADITTNLNLLATSIFPATFGPILATSSDQTNTENFIIERIACLLMEKPVPDEGVPSPSMTETCELRIEVLSLLSELALGSPHPHDRTDSSGEPHHGSLLLARHTTCLARLMRSMYDELEMLYTDPPTAPLHCILINNTTRLVYRIFKLHSDQIDMKPKWAAVPGGVQKQLIVLARLAFIEGPWMERGIDEDVAEMAHELLEEVVNLEEAGMVVQAFPHMARAGATASAKEVQDIDEDEEMAAADAEL